MRTNAHRTAYVHGADLALDSVRLTGSYTLAFLVHGFWAGRKSSTFGGLGGPGSPKNQSRRWGAKSPTFWQGCWGSRGRPEPKGRRLPAGQKTYFVLKTEVYVNGAAPRVVKWRNPKTKTSNDAWTSPTVLQSHPSKWHRHLAAITPRNKIYN